MISLLASLALACASQEAKPPVALHPVDEWDLELLPVRNIYRAYLADPRQCRSGTKVEFPLRKGDHVKIENTLGSYRPLALWTNPNDPGEEAEFYLEAAAFSRFDLDEAWDMDAADYKFGFPFAYRRDSVTLKFELYHVTSHIGDEFLSRGAGNGRGRDSYHLEELVFGGAWDPDPEFRFYGEAGVAAYKGTDTGNGRVQLGAEWVSATPWGGWLTPFAAMDFSARNEQSWTPNSTITGGVWVRGKSGSNGLRFALEYYRGRDQQTQFKRSHETFVAFNIAADF
jgi:uncharacterized protein DUF1207